MFAERQDVEIAGRRVGVFHPGTQHSWQTALAFQESGRLGWYATSVFYDAQRWPYRVERFLPPRLAEKANREFRRRWTPFLDPRFVRTFGLHEWLETAARRAGMFRLSQSLNISGNRHFTDGVIRLLQREPVDVVWGYNNSSLEVFRWAKRQGLTCVLDQTIGHPRAMNAVMQEERSRHPEFFPESVDLHDRAWIDQQDEEMALADLIVTGSEFCARTMIANGCPPEKLRVISYGFDESLFPDDPAPRARAPGAPASFLFLGSVDARKGVAYLLEAFAKVPPSLASLTLVGHRTVPSATFRRYADRVTYVRQVPRFETPGYFRRADVFVFPSLFEGSALVLYEAVGSGLGIIQSASSGTGATHGENGIILDPISVDGLAEAVIAAAESPDQVSAWQAESRRLRPARGWSVYRERLRSLTL